MTNHSKPLPHFVLTINERFLLKTNGAFHPYGVSGFTELLSAELRSRGLLHGMILYRRDARCSTPKIWESVDSGTRFVRFVFSFETPREILTQHFARAVAMLRAGASQESRPLVVYHQTPILVPLTPDDLPFVVTHHGPFAEQILARFGTQVAVAAFEGGHAKFAHLLKTQREGVEFLRIKKHGFALELSNVQANALRSYGLSSNRIAICAPTFYSVLCSNLRNRQPDAEGRVRLITAAARVDSFKRLELLIEAANLLSSWSIGVDVEIYAGNESDSPARAKLLSALLPPLRPRARIASCLRHDELIARLTDPRIQSIFVLTSIYETFGLTALESILAGNLTLVPDLPDLVGLSGIVPLRYRYHPTAKGLAEAIQALAAEFSRLPALGFTQQDELLSELRKQNFIDVLIACAVMSDSLITRSSPKALAGIDGEHEDDLGVIT